ncbi:MAG: response regulator [Gaiellales bacterium]|nr:MAG: response regulator [Gaiellales bacterium]
MGKRLLIVEQDSDIRLVLRIWLEARGYEIQELAGGWEVRETLQRSKFHGVILNCHLPDISAFTLVKLIREDGLSLPILLMSSAYPPYYEPMAETFGAQAFLPKPFSWDKVQGWLSKWVVDAAE